MHVQQAVSLRSSCFWSVFRPCAGKTWVRRRRRSSKLSADRRWGQSERLSAAVHRSPCLPLIISNPQHFQESPMHSLPICLLTLTTLLTGAEPDVPNKRPDCVHVLLVTGVDYEGHHWKDTGPALRNVLEKDKRLDVRIVEDPEFLSSPAISDYDVIIVHFKNYRPFVRDKQVHENLAKFRQTGKRLDAAPSRLRSIRKLARVRQPGGQDLRS